MPLISLILGDYGLCHFKHSIHVFGIYVIALVSFWLLVLLKNTSQVGGIINDALSNFSWKPI